MTLTSQVLDEIEAFLAAHNMPPSVFGEQACGDRHVIRNLRSGKSITLRRADQIRAFMHGYRSSSSDGGGRRGNGRRGNGRRGNEPRASAA